MPNSGWNVRKIVFLDWVCLVAVLKNAAALQEEVDLFLVFIFRRLASTMVIERDLTEPSYAGQRPTPGITFAEYRFIVAGRRRKIRGGFSQTGHVSVQPCRIDLPFLRNERAR
jgi:hypothetical protein